MSTSRPPAYASQRDDDRPDESPPPYTPNPTDDVSLEFGPTRPFRSPPQQPRQDYHQPPPQPPPLSDFARDFYATADRASRSTGNIHHPPQTQNPLPDDGRPTRTPVPGHPLLNNGRTLVYTTGYECDKCHNTGYKAFDPSNPCRRCWEKYSKPYSGPIIYSSWNDGSSNRQRPLLNLRSPATGPSLNRSVSSIVGQARNDFSSFPGNSFRQSHPHPHPPPPFPPPPTPPPRPHLPQHLPPPPPRHPTPSMNRGPSTPLVLQPGDPRIGGKPCWNCSGSGRTLGFLLVNDRTCDICRGIGRLL